MGNFSIQYNFTSASIAVSILSDDGYLGRPYSAQPDWASHVTLPVVFAGAMIGMSTMGRLGDVLGRGKAMRVTLFFTMVGAIIPALCVGSPDAVYGIVCFGRLILGIGVGGIYPLSAVSSAEGQKDPTLKSNTVAWAFFWQTVGAVVPYFIAMLMLAFIDPQPPQVWVPSLEFRMLFALGVVPAAVVFLSSLWTKDAEEFIPDPNRLGVIEMLRRQTPEVRRTLVGTAGSWFVYDLAYYGTAVFTPTILKDIFGQNQSLLATSGQSVIVSLMGVPGCIGAIVLVKRWGSKKLNVIGFIGLAVCFGVLALMWDQSKPPVLFGLFLVLTFLLNFGPNIGTYVLPAICFPMEVRSTCHGRCWAWPPQRPEASSRFFRMIYPNALPSSWPHQ